MPLPLLPPLDPMLAKAVSSVPPQPDDAPAFSYEPKWDGFRAIIFANGSDIHIGSRGSKELTRYFPELVDELRAQLTEPCVLDGEIVVRHGSPGRERLEWEALSARIHPAASRIAKLSAETPASFIAFDLLARGEIDLTSRPFIERRRSLETLLRSIHAPLHLTRATADAELARRWLDEFEGAGLDGVVAKRLDDPYAPGKRSMLKIKHRRTADVIITGYRMHKSGSGVGSLLLGLYDPAGTITSVGGASAFTDTRRRELIDELAPLVLRDPSGTPMRAESERNRFSTNRDTTFVQLRPERVAEVSYDQMEGRRFRHTVQFVRWRSDRDAESCTFEQLEQVAAYSLDEVLG